MKMTAEANNNLENTPVEVIQDDPSLVRQEAEKAPEDLRQETLDLIEAIRTKAQSEAQKAGDFARESYLDAVRRAREEVERLDLFEPNRIEEAIKQVQGEVEKDWESLVKQVTTVGDRLNEAAKAAWEKLTASEPDKPQE
jgi:hypothetical protein